MIDINNISAGWADLHIGYCMFSVSYLTDLKFELDTLFNLSNSDVEVNKVILEGEGQGDLSLVAHLTFENVNDYLPTNRQRDSEHKYDYVINIIWQRLFSCEGNSFSILKFPYKEFMEEYNNLVADIKENYVKNFMMPFDDDEHQEMLESY